MRAEKGRRKGEGERERGERERGAYATLIFLLQSSRLSCKPSWWKRRASEMLLMIG